MIGELMTEIELALPDGGPWCSLEKAQTLACLVVGLRPWRIVEIGVWMGGSLVPMLLALRKLGAGQATAIDPWEASASIAGQDGDNRTWWEKVDHDAALRVFCDRLARHGLESYCHVERKRSSDAAVPGVIDLLHVDGNHAEQAVRDVEKFAPAIRCGGVLVLDDLGWTGGHVRAAYARALEIGFRELYPLGTGCVMQRTEGAA